MTSNNTPIHTSAKAAMSRNNSGDPEKKTKRQPTPLIVYAALVAFAVISYVTLPNPLQPHHGEEPSIRHVFYYGWLTAISTGLGAIPLAFAPDLPSYWVGISNAIAAGMMIAASYSLLFEGCTFDDPKDSSSIPVVVRTAMGAIIGLIFINVMEKFLSGHEELSVGGLAGADAKRALLIFFVMTLHSFSEGVGIGVSFGGVHGSELGVFISASLAVHNIPEGLAMAVTLMPRGTSLPTAIVFAVLTSFPQPLMAVPAYVFVHHFIPILPAGLGFAGGAMAWVALFELLMEAIEDSGLLTTAVVSTISLAGMHFLNEMIDAGARS
ncbi:zinc/iron permease [Nitzschia inconspicua]|uniref:Zinc/iron permease n=1 Tax=Nitzschia inconspicua TaxID=303405 RepID=A0A9K3LMN1_9STRA|nr:zinc/iron permease [Nitzschia inconspicua]